MQLDVLSPTRAALAERIEPHWRGPLLSLALAWCGALALFAPEWAAMARQWWDSSTYNHILVVPAILGWLVWQRAPELAELRPQAWWPGLIAVAGALLLWLLGDVSGVALASQLGAVLLLQASVIAVLGPRATWALLFPLAYALFLVPFGDELVPALQMITAAITIWLTEASGIPAAIEGVFIDTPAGLFEVAEACSGVKFLIAMVALGMLVAHVCFRSWRRRAVFMVVAIVLPILANGVRAWGTIYIAQSQGIEFAAGFDHIVYGWVFFAVVMGALLAGSWRWFDRDVDEAFIDPAAIAAIGWIGRLERFGARGWQVLLAMLALVVAALAWSSLASRTEAALPQSLALPEVPGWTQVDPQHAYPWQPLIPGADRLLVASFADANGRVVDVVYALYGAQEDGREAGAFGQGAQPPGSEWRWLSSETPIAEGQAMRMQALGSHQRVALTWFRHGDWLGGSRPRLKLLTMRDRLLLRAQPTAMLILSAEQQGGQDAHATLAEFHAATADLAGWMDRAAGVD